MTTRRVLRAANLTAQVIAALLSLAVVVGSGFAWSAYRSFESNVVHVNVIVGATVTPNDGVQVVDDGKDQNILLVGKDDRSTATDQELNVLGIGGDGGGVLTDAMMILHIPSDGAKASLISFPRDSYVAIPGNGHNKLNAAYAFGSNFGKDPDAGIRLLIETLQNITGLTIDHYVGVDLIGFYRITNALGGVPINLCEDVDDGLSGVHLKKGEQTLEGVQALAFVRQRHGLDAYGGDLARVTRQRYVLSQLFTKLQSAGTLSNPVKIKSLLSAVSSSLAMDVDLDPLELANQMRHLTGGGITEATIPTLGDSYVGEMDVENVDFAGMTDFISTMVGTATDPKLAGAPVVAPSTVTVDVLNGAGIGGIAKSNADALQALGFAIGTVTDSQQTSLTTIRYPDGMQSQAKTLAAQVPGAVLVKATSVSRVTLIIGSNNQQVATLMPPGTATPPTTSTTNESTDTRTGDDIDCIH
jgi:LCP family protein required for cell wall assembly